jgi:biopolymer transport protein ExbB
VDATTLLRLLNDGGLTVYPLALGSIITLAVLIERSFAYRGLERGSRELTRQVVALLVQRDLESARGLCAKSRSSLADIFTEAMRWKNVSLEDLERILSTSRQEAAAALRRGLWLVGTIGSLAPYVGLFGTVVGIIRAFQDMAAHGAGGFEVVAAGISEALVATAAGLVVAIVALAIFNWLQVQAQAHAATYARCCERFVQALLYVEAAAGDDAAVRGVEGGRGSFAPSR